MPKVVRNKRSVVDFDELELAKKLRMTVMREKIAGFNAAINDLTIKQYHLVSGLQNDLIENVDEFGQVILQNHTTTRDLQLIDELDRRNGYIGPGLLLSLGCQPSAAISLPSAGSGSDSDSD
jgi:hypothetical protein